MDPFRTTKKQMTTQHLRQVNSTSPIKKNTKQRSFLVDDEHSTASPSPSRSSQHHSNGSLFIKSAKKLMSTNTKMVPSPIQKELRQRTLEELDIERCVEKLKMPPNTSHSRLLEKMKMVRASQERIIADSFGPSWQGGDLNDGDNDNNNNNQLIHQPGSLIQLQEIDSPYLRNRIYEEGTTEDQEGDLQCEQERNNNLNLGNNNNNGNNNNVGNINNNNNNGSNNNNNPHNMAMEIEEASPAQGEQQQQGQRPNLQIQSGQMIMMNQMQKIEDLPFDEMDSGFEAYDSTNRDDGLCSSPGRSSPTYRRRLLSVNKIEDFFEIYSQEDCEMVQQGGYDGVEYVNQNNMNGILYCGPIEEGQEHNQEDFN